MREKPSVLSDERIGNIWETWAGIDCPSFEEAKTLAVTRLKAIAQAQRDADVAYYEPIIQQARKPKTRIIDITRAKKKVRQDTAREIFEEIDNHRYLSTFDAWQTKCWGISDNDLQELKDKWLKGSK